MKKFPVIPVNSILPTNRKVKRVFIHCSASDNDAHDDASVIDEWHRQRGFAGIGYHWFIKSNGELQVGRDMNLIPAAQKNHNAETFAVCLHGLKKENFTQAQMKTLKALVNHLDMLYKGALTFHGHCEVEPNKTCPVFDYRAVLNLDERGRIKRSY